MNLRVIKKDVAFVINEFMSDALLSYNFAKDEDKKEKITEILNESLALYDETIDQINLYKQVENVKSHFRAVRDDFNNSIDVLFDKLSEVVR